MTRPSDLAASDAWQAEHVRFAPNRYAARRTVERCQNRSLFCAIAWQNRSTPKFQLRKNRHCSRNADFGSELNLCGAASLPGFADG
jgi:hypothetical protein